MPYVLTAEGKEWLAKGLPERQLLQFLAAGPKPMDAVAALPRSEIAIGWARRNSWITVTDVEVKLTELGERMLAIRSALELAVESIARTGVADPESVAVLLGRGLIAEVRPSLRERLLGKPAPPAAAAPTEIAQLTPELIKSGRWQKLPFRRYDVAAPAPALWPGKRQPYIQFLEDIRERLIGLGFQEMSGPLVELMFWNCDALFMPQDHPARGIHDIFTIKDRPGKIDPELAQHVKATHESGWITGSSGWGGSWLESAAAKVIMRSQTTAVSARTLAKLGERPGKYFCIGRNFRPDLPDAKHLPEFYQCEGIVVGERLTFRHLLGYLKDFAAALGIREVRFKPGYFPFTEPSVEGYVRHPKLGWIEVLPAGLLRPEVLRPLGIERAQVLAWGIGIDRLAMIKLGVDDIRMLFSPDLDWLRRTPMVMQ